MKVYVEKLPKGCLSCPYIVDKGDYDLCAIKDCVIDDAFKYIDKRKKSCPLRSLSDYTKQVINNTFDKINSEYAKRLSAFMGTKISVSTAISKLDEVLDHIQGE